MLDIANGDLWAVPAFGMGAYENITRIDTGDTSHVAFMLYGTSLVSGAVFAANPGAAWRVRGAGDFNRDGHADIAWQHDDGSIAVWSMQDSATLLAGPTTGIVTGAGAGRNLSAIGDYNGDGNADMLLQNTLTGQLDVWTMNGANLTPVVATMAQNPGLAWRLVG